MKNKHKEHAPPHAREDVPAGTAPVPTPETPATTPAVAKPEASGQTVAQVPVAETETELRKKADEFKDRYARALADFDNYRKRVQRDFVEIRQQERRNTLQPLLAVLDHFQMAREHFEKSADPEGMKQGFAMIADEFAKALADLGVEVLNAAGQPFDPNRHEAVSQEPSAVVPAGHVLRQWKAGYKLGEVLLRPAVVVVSSGAPTPAPAPPPAPTPAAEEQEDA